MSIEAPIIDSLSPFTQLIVIRISSLFEVLLCVTVFCDLSSSQDGDGKTDENRPYKFGFNIEGYQHRHEEKGELHNVSLTGTNFVPAKGLSHLKKLYLVMF